MQLAGKKTMIWINNRILRLSWQCFKTVPVYAQLFNVLFCIFIIVPRQQWHIRAQNKIIDGRIHCKNAA